MARSDLSEGTGSASFSNKYWDYFSSAALILGLVLGVSIVLLVRPVVAGLFRKDKD